MGVCTSSQIPRRLSIEKRAAAAEMATAKVMHMDGSLEEYAKVVKAWQVAEGSPGCYVCSSEAMLVGRHAPALPDEEELQPGQLYFLLPLSAARQPLSLADLCRLAVKASAALQHCRLSLLEESRRCPSAAVEVCKSTIAI